MKKEIVKIVLPETDEYGNYVDSQIGLHEYFENLPKLGDIFIVTQIIPKKVMAEIRLTKCDRRPTQRAVDAAPASVTKK